MQPCPNFSFSFKAFVSRPDLAADVYYFGIACIHYNAGNIQIICKKIENKNSLEGTPHFTPLTSE